MSGFSMPSSFRLSFGSRRACAGLVFASFVGACSYDFEQFGDTKPGTDGGPPTARGGAAGVDGGRGAGGSGGKAGSDGGGKSDAAGAGNAGSAGASAGGAGVAGSAGAGGA